MRFLVSNRLSLWTFGDLNRLAAESMMEDGGKTGPFCRRVCLCRSYHYCLWQFHFLNSPIRFLESVCIMHFQTNVTTKRSYQAALGSSSANSLAKLVDRCRRGRAGASGRSRGGVHESGLF